MRFALIIAAVCLWVGCAPQQHTPGRHYFSWAGLKTCPPVPSSEITQQEAERIESQGGAYYIAEYGMQGRLMILEKRLDRAVFLRQEIEWSPGGVATCKETTSSGDEKAAAQALVPRDGFVPDAETAIHIAEAVWIPIYGEKSLEDERPFTATLRDGVWIVSGTLRQGQLGGVAEARIAKRDGCILSVVHGQ